MAARSVASRLEVQTTAVADEIILRLSVYRDLNANGRIDFNDPRIATLRNGLGDVLDEDGDGVRRQHGIHYGLDGSDCSLTGLSFALDGETLAAGVGTTDDPAESGERRHYMVVVDSMATYVDVVGGRDVSGETLRITSDFDFTVGGASPPTRRMRRGGW